MSNEELLAKILALVRLHANKGSIADPRRFYGCELKDEYIEAARVNCERAERDVTRQSRMIWDEAVSK